MVVLLLIALQSGCREEPGVRQYQARKETKTTPQVPMSQPRATEGGAKRLLAAIIDHAGQTWFIKLMGPVDAVAGEAQNFQDFVHSLTFSESGERPLSWTLPEGWHEEPATPPRYATIHAGQDHALEVTISSFPGDVGGILANINRWRGQIGLPPITDGPELQSIAETHDVSGKPVIEVDMTGPGASESATPMTPPSEPVGAPPASAESLGEPVEGPLPDSPITYTLPEGWIDHGPDGQMRIASFSAGPQDNPAITTVIPLDGVAGGILQNVNRWRTQVGLPEIGPEDSASAGQPFEIDGQRAHYFDLAGPVHGMLAVIATRGDTTWFIKMVGPVELVRTEKERFESLARSIRFQ